MGVTPGTYQAYATFNDRKNWADAAAACASKGMILAAVTSGVQAAAFREMIKRAANSGSEYWMGGRTAASTSVWTWPWGGAFYPGPCAEYTWGDAQGVAPWMSGEPNCCGARCG